MPVDVVAAAVLVVAVFDIVGADVVDGAGAVTNDEEYQTSVEELMLVGDAVDEVGVVGAATGVVDITGVVLLV